MLEAAYASVNPADFAELVSRYGHTAIKPTQYSASAYLVLHSRQAQPRRIHPVPCRSGNRTMELQRADLLVGAAASAVVDRPCLLGRSGSLDGLRPR